jgi:hypothetical protein
MNAKTINVFTWTLALLLCSTFFTIHAQTTKKVTAQEARSR